MRTGRAWRMASAAVIVLGGGAVVHAEGLSMAKAGFTLPQALAYPFVSDLTADHAGKRIAWLRIVDGVRNIWVADAPGFVPRQVTQFRDDDGQELTQLAFAPDGKTLVFVRGGDHDSNWPAAGNLQPNPVSGPDEPKITLWTADPSGAKPAAKLVEGDAPLLSATGMLAYVKDGQVWTARLGGKDAKGERLFFDHGKASALAWSPDGRRLAFVSMRDDHSFIGIWSGAARPIRWIAPTTSFDGAPVWSPDGTRIAFTRQPGRGGAPEPLLENVPAPWSIWVGDASSGAARQVWASGAGLRDSYPDVAGEANLKWTAGDRLTFLSEADNWPHLYSVSAGGGPATLLTPGAFMAEHLSLSPDGLTLFYSANTGTTPDDDDRRHLYRVATDGRTPPVTVTSGASLEWQPAALADGVAFIAAGAKRPPAIAVADARAVRRDLAGQAPPAGFAGAQFVVPRQVSWKAPDGLLIHGQLFQAAGAARQPGVVFVHGGPPRQMMLGFSYMRYYSNAYAMNQYLAAHGFAVLSVNYRLGIGYGYDFQHPDRGGPAGSSEYQDVKAGAQWLQKQPGVDPDRIGIWGGSYGGLLTGLALARDSKLFKAGVDLHGVHDWSRILAEALPVLPRYEQGDRAAATKVAFEASPVADVATWTSPVLFIHGDDDRNVRFNQTIDLVKRLQAKGGVDYEELVIPDEIHDFLRHRDWLTADTATAEFLTRKLGVK